MPKYLPIHNIAQQMESKIKYIYKKEKEEEKRKRELRTNAVKSISFWWGKSLERNSKLFDDKIK